MLLLFKVPLLFHSKIQACICSLLYIKWCDQSAGSLSLKSYLPLLLLVEVDVNYYKMFMHKVFQCSIWLFRVYSFLSCNKLWIGRKNLSDWHWGKTRSETYHEKNKGNNTMWLVSSDISTIFSKCLNVSVYYSVVCVLLLVQYFIILVTFFTLAHVVS